MVRKSRIDSISGMLAAASAVQSPLPVWPKCLSFKSEYAPFWEAIIRGRSRAEWNESATVLAAQLAKVQSDLESESRLLDSEGSIIRNDKGTRIANPRFSVAQQLSQRQLSIVRALQLMPQIDARELKKQREAERQAEAIRDQMKDSLLA